MWCYCDLPFTIANGAVAAVAYNGDRRLTECACSSRWSARRRTPRWRSTAPPSRGYCCRQYPAVRRQLLQRLRHARLLLRGTNDSIHEFVTSSTNMDGFIFFFS